MALETVFANKLKQQLQALMQFESVDGRVWFHHTAQAAMAVCAEKDLSALNEVEPTALSTMRSAWELQQASIIKSYRSSGEVRHSILITIPVLQNATHPVGRVTETFADSAFALGTRFGLVSRQSTMHFWPRPLSFDSLAELSYAEVYHLNQALFSYLVQKNRSVPVALKRLLKAEGSPERRHRRHPFMQTSFVLGIVTIPAHDYGCHLMPHKMASAFRAMDYRDWCNNQRWSEKMSHHVETPGRQFPQGMTQFYEGLTLGRLVEYRNDAGNALIGLINGTEPEDYNLLALGPMSNEERAEMLVLSSDGKTLLNRVEFSLAGFTNQPLASFEMMLMDMATTHRVQWGGKIDQL